MLTKSQNQLEIWKKTYPSLAIAFQDIQKEQYELFAQKMMDYGLGNISLGTNLDDSDDDTTIIDWYLVRRCNDKINRLKNMLKRKGRNYVKDEPMIDSFIDIANYGIIAMLVMRGQWKK
jgi:hypothetical protein